MKITQGLAQGLAKALGFLRPRISISKDSEALAQHETPGTCTQPWARGGEQIKAEVLTSPAGQGAWSRADMVVMRFGEFLTHPSLWGQQPGPP